MEVKTRFDIKLLENCTDALRAVAHPLRIEIIRILYSRKEMTVSEIFDYLNIEQAIASHHLRILRDQDIVDVRRDGKNSIYYLTDNKFYEIVEIITTIVK